MEATGKSLQVGAELNCCIVFATNSGKRHGLSDAILTNTTVVRASQTLRCLGL